MNVLFTEPGKSLLEHDPQQRLFVAHWHSYQGPHYRKTLEALLTHVKQHGGRTYISDASRPTDVQSQEDLKWIAEAVKELPKNGITRMIVVVPKSAIAKMGAKRVVQAASVHGMERIEVGTYEEALALAKK